MTVVVFLNETEILTGIMEFEKVIKSLKYVPKIWTALSFPILILIALTLFFGRNINSLKINYLLNAVPEFYNHISNFSISFIIYITIGYVGLMSGLTTKKLVLIGALIVLLNLIVEFYISILNIPDSTDASFGILGVLLGLIFLATAKKYGLKKNEL